MSDEPHLPGRDDTSLVLGSSFLARAELAEHIIETIREPLVVLDGDLRVKAANRAFYATFRVDRGETEGRLLYELGNGQWDIPHLRRLLEEILPSKNPFNDFEVVHDFEHIGRKAMLLNARRVDRDGVPEFILLAIEDVTDRREGEGVMPMLQAAVEAANDAVIITEARLDEPGPRMEYVNPAFERMTGYTKAEAIGRTPRILQGPKTSRELLERLRRDLTTVQEFAGQTTNYRKDGTEYEVEWRIAGVRDADGEVLRWVAVQRDVTQKVRDARDLSEARGRLETALEAGTIGVWSWKAEEGRGDVVEGESNFARIFGLPQQEARRLPFDRFMALVAPEDRRRVGSKLREVLASGNSYGEDCRLALADGTDRWVILRGRVDRRPDGSAAGVTGAVVDVTDLKRTKEQLRESEDRAAFVRKSSGVGFWYCDLPFGVMEWDEAGKGHLQLPADARVTIETFYERIHPDDRGAIREAVERAVAEHSPFDATFRTLNRETKAERWVRAMGRTFYIQGGVPTRFDGITLDVTASKRTEEERERMLRESERLRADAEAANRMKDEFLATLSHELRTPLNAIVGWARMLSGGRMGPADVKEGVAVINRNANAQAQLIEDLLDISSIMSGKLRLDVQRVDLKSVIEAALQTVATAAEAKDIRLRTVLDGLVGPVTGDATRLQQVVWNLLTNAVKFTPRGGQVQVLLERVNSHVELSVIDTGQGIRPEFLPFVFDRFRQADSSTTRHFGGLGLGLSIVKQLVEMHGGSIRAKSPGVNQGATFVVALPITIVHEGDKVAAKVGPRDHGDEEEPDCSTHPLAGVNVLVVDDEPDSRMLVRRVLADCGAEVRLASSVSEALEVLGKFTPHVLVSDIGMPGEDGYDLIRQVRAGGRSSKSLPAAALTAFARSEDRMRALRAGFQTHVAKPVDPGELIAVVASLAGKTD